MKLETTIPKIVSTIDDFTNSFVVDFSLSEKLFPKNRCTPTGIPREEMVENIVVRDITVEDKPIFSALVI